MFCAGQFEIQAQANEIGTVNRKTRDYTKIKDEKNKDVQVRNVIILKLKKK